MGYLENFLEMWNESATTFPDLKIMFSNNEKISKEKYLQQFFNDFKCENGPGKSCGDNMDQNKLFASLKEMFREALGYSDRQLNIIFSDQMYESTCEFIIAARKFDADLSIESIFQACRNVWIMNGVQFLLDRKVALTPSIFAYSMLYPYTDNFIDDPLISGTEKMEFSERFSQRLNNQKIAAKNLTEEKIFSLVAMIEREWDRELYPGVYKSLNGIHEAQTRSMFLLTGNCDLTPDRAMELCADKGGASVVADGFLIKGVLNNSQEEFLYMYGAYLQLLDDLQDLGEDSGSGLMTCFAMAAKEGRIDKCVNKLFWLARKIIDVMSQCDFTDRQNFLSLIDKSFFLFIAASVLSNRDFVSNNYLARIEKYIPVSYDYAEKQNKVIGDYKEVMIQVISEFAFNNQ